LNGQFTGGIRTTIFRAYQRRQFLVERIYVRSQVIRFCTRTKIREL